MPTAEQLARWFATVSPRSAPPDEPKRLPQLQSCTTWRWPPVGLTRTVTAGDLGLEQGEAA